MLVTELVSNAVRHAEVGPEQYLRVEPRIAEAARLGYRLCRNPLVMFGVGPIYGLLLQPRLVSRSERHSRSLRH